VPTGKSCCQGVDHPDGVLRRVGEAQVGVGQHKTDAAQAAHLQKGDAQGPPHRVDRVTTPCPEPTRTFFLNRISSAVVLPPS